jgi:hypothetical protein
MCSNWQLIIPPYTVKINMKDNKTYAAMEVEFLSLRTACTHMRMYTRTHPGPSQQNSEVSDARSYSYVAFMTLILISQNS